jgi:exodeoxyribonuclease-3
VRLVAWNCRSGSIDLKLRALRKLRFDIAVVPEAQEPDAISESTVWFGESGSRGVLVVSSAHYRLTTIAMPDLPKFFVPIAVDGAERFLLIAIWAMPNDRESRYVRGVVRAVEACASLIAGQSTVLMGDFNSNPYWDSLFPRTANHSTLVERLRDLGCVSAYHHLSGEEHGAESVPTYFQYNHRDKPYHLDYCFLPAAWSSRLQRVTIARHDQWRRWSDHRPLIVELDRPRSKHT